MKPRSINIFLLDGDPNGIRVAQISMSTIQAIAFRRNQLKRAREAFPEMERPGVYILVGSDEHKHDGHLAYIGESEGVGARLAYHNSNETGRDAKGFWTDTVVLISKDENLTKSHARYVEACLVRSAGGNLRWSVPNSRLPADDAGKLPLQDRSSMDEFVEQTRTLVGALGWDLFREMRRPPPEKAPADRPVETVSVPTGPDSDRPVFSFEGNGYAARMEIGPSGELIVKSGSLARIRTTATIPKGIIELRQALVESGVLEPTDGAYLFTADYGFSSVSAAAATVIGASANGRISWRLADGRTYAEWESAQNAGLPTVSGEDEP